MLDVKKLEIELISCLLILLLVNGADLVFLVLKLNLKTIESANLVLLLCQICKVNWAQTHILELPYLRLLETHALARMDC